MASLLFAGGVLAYEKIKESKAKKHARKAHNAARYSDLQSSTCICSNLEKNTVGCPVHDPSTQRDNNTIDVGSVERRTTTVANEKERGKEKEKKGMYSGENDDDLYYEVPRRQDAATTTTGTTVRRGGVGAFDVDGSRSMGDKPPKYEDVAGLVGFQERERRDLERGKNGEKSVR
ncbi:MAG: hypothetical protein Q9178_005297 [Gyalolechia marmorata]